MIILGIDPGSAITGFGILENSKDLKSVRVVDFGCITTESSKETGERLKDLYGEMKKLIAKHKPDAMAIENLFFFKNLKTVMPVSQAKGVILLAAAEKKVPAHEFTPLQVKMAITGYGKADKSQVQKMTQILLDLKRFDMKENHRKKDDASDALAVALCYALQEKSKHPLNKGRKQ